MPFVESPEAVLPATRVLTSSASAPPLTWMPPPSPLPAVPLPPGAPMVPVVVVPVPPAPPLPALPPVPAVAWFSERVLLDRVRFPAAT